MHSYTVHAIGCTIDTSNLPCNAIHPCKMLCGLDSKTAKGTRRDSAQALQESKRPQQP